jgi:hypothetical protein
MFRIVPKQFWFQFWLFPIKTSFEGHPTKDDRACSMPPYTHVCWHSESDYLSRCVEGRGIVDISLTGGGGGWADFQNNLTAWVFITYPFPILSL